jgi:hypothetical protein
MQTSFINTTGEVTQIQMPTKHQRFIKPIENLKSKFKDFDFKICYEATYIGFTLQRDLAAGRLCFRRHRTEQYSKSAW